MRRGWGGAGGHVYRGQVADGDLGILEGRGLWGGIGRSPKPGGQLAQVEGGGVHQPLWQSSQIVLGVGDVGS